MAFAKGRIGEALLTATRVAAWNRTDGRDCGCAGPEVSRVRAVLCVLYPDRPPTVRAEPFDELRANGSRRGK